ncbi:MAG: Uncharacterised protein [SAR92 bacterium MED-G29]|jgi:hypothetical protein|nr:MAG: Uncharacterised protein [SAR92 bacterium MED-G29]
MGLLSHALVKRLAKLKGTELAPRTQSNCGQSCG